MKKYLSLMLIGAIVAFASCTNDTDHTRPNADEVVFELNAGLNPATRADLIGGGITNVSGDYSVRFILEIYNSGDALVKRIVNLEELSAPSTTFSERLMAGEYRFAVWADFTNEGSEDDLVYKTTDGLQAVSINDDYSTSAAVGGRTLRDAYCGVTDVDLSASGASVGMTLSRPFGRIEVISTDMEEVIDITGAPIGEAQVTYVTIPAAYNVLSGDIVSGVTLTAPMFRMDFDTAYTTGDALVSYDYIFAPKEGQEGVSFTVEAYDADAAKIAERRLIGIPVEKNKITRVTGNVFTNEGALSVSINDDFTDPGTDVTIEETIVESIADALEAGNVLKADVENLVVTDEVAADSEIKIADGTTADVLSFNFQGGIADNTTITIGDQTDGGANTYAGVVNIIAPENVSASTVVVNLPNATVRIYNSIGELISTVGPNTLIIDAAATVGKLTVNKGNVKIYGNVDEIVKGGAYADTITWYASTAAAFGKAVQYADVIAVGESALDLGAANAVVINRAVTITGASAAKSVINGAFNASANIILKNVTLNSVINPVVSLTGTATLMTSGVVINQNKEGSSDGITTAPAAITANGDVALYNTKINLNGTKYMRGINASGNVLMDNSSIRTLSADAATPANATSSRGINLFDNAGLSVTIRNGSSLAGLYYPVNITPACSGVNVTIENSRIDGYCSLNVWAADGTYNITGSKLIGRNNYSGASSDFSVIVLNKDAVDNAQNNAVVITNSELSNVMTGTCLEYMFSLRGDNNSVQLKGATKLVDSSQSLPYMASILGTGNSITHDAAVKLIGQTGVLLMEVPAE